MSTNCRVQYVDYNRDFNLWSNILFIETEKLILFVDLRQLLSVWTSLEDAVIRLRQPTEVAKVIILFVWSFKQLRRSSSNWDIKIFISDETRHTNPCTTDNGGCSSNEICTWGGLSSPAVCGSYHWKFCGLYSNPKSFDQIFHEFNITYIRFFVFEVFYQSDKSSSRLAKKYPRKCLEIF